MQKKLNLQRLILLPVKEFDVYHEETAELLYSSLERSSLNSDRLARNYKRETLRIEDHDIFHALFCPGSDSFVSFCGVLNAGRYPPGCFRILNRAFVFPQYRVKSAYSFINSRLIMPAQLKLLGNNFEFLFVSREGPKGYLSLRQWTQKMGLQSHWRVDERFFHVAPEGRDSSCFQNVAYHSKSSLGFPLPHLELDHWHRLKKADFDLLNQPSK